jgi:hypothetical protein
MSSAGNTNSRCLRRSSVNMTIDSPDGRSPHQCDTHRAGAQALAAI